MIANGWVFTSFHFYYVPLPDGCLKNLSLGSWISSDDSEDEDSLDSEDLDPPDSLDFDSLELKR